MAGSSIFDYVHQADHAEVAEQLGLSLTGHAGMASPSSSEEGTSHGTMNPDGELKAVIILKESSDHTFLSYVNRILKIIRLIEPKCNLDYSYPVSSSMTLTSTSKYKGLERAFCVRMKSTLTKRGCHFKQSSGYRVS